MLRILPTCAIASKDTPPFPPPAGVGLWTEDERTVSFVRDVTGFAYKTTV